MREILFEKKSLMRFEEPHTGFGYFLLQLTSF